VRGVKEKTILLLENDEDDVFVFRRALLALGFSGQVRVVSNLSAARAYMLGADPFRDRNYFPLPDLIVADFGLGGERGSDFVQWLCEHPEFVKIPIIFFSGSLPEAGMRDLFNRFGLAVFKKDVDFHANTKNVAEMIKLLEQPPSDDQPSA
jgi:CheY-like chemotaxis protein